MEQEPDIKKVLQKAILIPALAAIFWLIGTIFGYVVADMIFETSAAVTALTIFWSLIWCIALCFSAFMYYKANNLIEIN